MSNDSADDKNLNEFLDGHSSNVNADDLSKMASRMSDAEPATRRVRRRRRHEHWKFTVPLLAIGGYFGTRWFVDAFTFGRSGNSTVNLDAGITILALMIAILVYGKYSQFETS